ncbi:MAG TPA: glycosyltransferase [Vicinamibacterales bacterium]|nr:glycosyltransferase [Vicinamibacterales bacterium]
MNADLLCLSHLRWNVVHQRPRELMTRFAARRRVYFLEEPVVGTGFPFLSVTRSDGVRILTPQLPRGIEGDDAEMLIRQLLRAHLREHGVIKPIHWFCTPMMQPIVDALPAAAIAFDCTDELSVLAVAPPELVAREQALLARADVVFTGGHSLFERKRQSHPNVHAFPSSIDVEHFAQARRAVQEPDDQRHLLRPRIGFCGIVDERVDLRLIDAVARLRPYWQLVMIGPATKVDSAAVPRAANIHYLGMKSYDDLPRYLAGWDVAMLPYARNDSTRYINPTKTPEYLAAGRPVVSTSVRDVVRPYGERQLVRIADTPEAFVAAVEHALVERAPPPAVDAFLASLSWDRTWAAMDRLLEAAVSRRAARAPRRPVSRLDPHPAAGAIDAQLTGEA